jgi:multicomponent Na+:H+ antiporter subunit F
MNAWLVTAMLLMLLIAPCGFICLTASVMERFAALQMAQLFATLVVLLLAEGFRRVIYFDLALLMAVLSFASGLVYVRFLERWL